MDHMTHTLEHQILFWILKEEKRCREGSIRSDGKGDEELYFSVHDLWNNFPLEGTPLTREFLPVSWA